MPHRFFSRFIVAVLFIAWAHSAFAEGNRAAVITGSFDPPTKAHKALINAAISNRDVSKVYLLVNTTGTKDYKASFSERKAMLETMLRPHLGRVEIRAQEQETKNAAVRSLAEKHQGVVQYIGEDSYWALPASEQPNESRTMVVVRRPDELARRLFRLPNPHVTFVTLDGITGISSTGSRNALFSGKSTEALLEPEVDRYIRRHKLYRVLPSELQDLQRALYHESLAAFAFDMRTLAPNLKLVPRDAPTFNPMQSKFSWADKSVRWLSASVKRQGAGIPNANEIVTEAQKTLIGTFKNESYVKLFYLEPVTMSDVESAPEILSARPVRFPAPKANETYTLNVNTYVADRLPESVQRFVTDHRVQLFLHDGAAKQALAFHRQAGFTQGYLVNTRRGQPHRIVHLVQNPKTNTFRLVLSEIRSADRMAHVIKQLGAAKIPHSGMLVRHKEELPLFELNAAGKKLRFDHEDQLIIGFKNNLWRMLSVTNEWTRANIVKGAAEIDVYRNRRTGARIINARAVYGDDVIRLAETFYERGVRRFTYFGTAGALDPAMDVGDTLLVDKVSLGGNQWLRFDNKAVKLAAKVRGDLSDLHRGVAHGNVRAILDESDQFLRRKQAEGVQSLDVELKHLVTYLNKKSDATLAALMFVSDTPLGQITLDEHNANSHLVKDAFARVAKPLAMPSVRTKAYLAPQKLPRGALAKMLRDSGDPHLRAIFALAAKHKVLIGSWGGSSRALLAGERVTTDYDIILSHEASKHRDFTRELRQYGEDNHIKIDVVFRFGLNNIVYAGQEFGLNQGGDLSINRIGLLSDGRVLDPLNGFEDFKAKTLRFASIEPEFTPGVGSIIRTSRFIARMPEFSISDKTVMEFMLSLRNETGRAGASVAALSQFASHLQQHHGFLTPRASDPLLEREYAAWRYLVRQSAAVSAIETVKASHELDNTYVGSYFRERGSVPDGANYLDVWKNMAKMETQSKDGERFDEFCTKIGLKPILQKLFLWPNGVNDLIRTKPLM